MQPLCENGIPFVGVRDKRLNSSTCIRVNLCINTLKSSFHVSNILSFI